MLYFHWENVTQVEPAESAYLKKDNYCILVCTPQLAALLHQLQLGVIRHILGCEGLGYIVGEPYGLE